MIQTVTSNNMPKKTIKAPPGAPGASLVPKTKVLPVSAQRETAEKLLALFDEWNTHLGSPTDPKRTKKLREALKRTVARKDDPKTRQASLAINVPLALSLQIDGTKQKNFKDGLVHLYGRKRNEIVSWSLDQGVKNLSLKVLLGAYPNVKPSLSLVSLLALCEGLEQFPKYFAPVLHPKSSRHDK